MIRQDIADEDGTEVGSIEVSVSRGREDAVEYALDEYAAIAAIEELPPFDPAPPTVDMPDSRELRAEFWAQVLIDPDGGFLKLPALTNGFSHVSATNAWNRELPDGTWYPYVGVTDGEITTSDDAMGLADALNKVAIATEVMNADSAVEVPASSLGLDKAARQRGQPDPAELGWHRRPPKEHLLR